MKRKKSKANKARYDRESEVYVGPSSRPFHVAQVAQSAWFKHRPEDLNFSHTLSSSSLAVLASRCSTKTIQDQVKEKMEDRTVVEAIRKRISDWGDLTITEEEEEEEKVQNTLPDKKRKRGRRLSTKAEDDAADYKELALEEIDKIVPIAFRYVQET